MKKAKRSPQFETETTLPMMRRAFYSAVVCDALDSLGLRPFADAFPVLAENIRLARGPQKSPTKVRVTLRLDRSTLEAFKADGPGWQTRIGEVLAKAKG